MISQTKSKPVEGGFNLQLFVHDTDITFPGMTVPFIRLATDGAVLVTVDTSIASLLPLKWMEVIFEQIESREKCEQWGKKLMEVLGEPSRKLEETFSPEAFAGVKTGLLAILPFLCLTPDEEKEFTLILECHLALLATAAAHRRPIERGEDPNLLIMPAFAPKEGGVQTFKWDPEKKQLALVA